MVMHASLTVLFEDPFWVGIFERRGNGCYQAAKVTFGAEPSNEQLYRFLLEHYNDLRFSDPIADDGEQVHTANPKRLKRDAKRQMERQGVGTKAQRALAAQHAQSKIERERISREQRQREDEHRYELRRRKARSRHRGK